MGRVFALKVIFENHKDSMRHQICTEIEILRDVDNPNMVKCHDMFDHNGEIQVLLEYMDRGSLEGVAIDQGIAYTLMVLALLLTYMIH
ncbi:hypothetical protein SO802_002711 [Lithocarpus litseifolius]|uniref:Protein kinase domain-containing protein n=1 Tax=Lithocarpus litseifolius TaxID=425828 RepID=A0AAW2DYJ6_9ROSI